MTARRIPVWLLTGWLGSGKTTLLAAWLRDRALADAALIINELGEVGLDDRLLAGAVDGGTSLVANACVCCTGLPGLEEALSDLFWDRLHRRRPAFGSVVIETTGLADPAPVVALFDSVPLLHERYALAGVITCVSANAGEAMLATHAEARVQVLAADAVIITKTDRAPADAAASAVRALNRRAGVAVSALASLSWAQVQALGVRGGVPEAQFDHHDSEHHHAADASFIAIDEPLSEAALHACIQRALCAGTLLRLKGVVRRDDSVLYEVQWSAGDTQATVRPIGQGVVAPRLGLTCIVAR